ncbi:WD40 repeat domain-containing protein [Cytobacillus spongiae]|uniref:YncE family protein n=1 Tax=Cytobacillus spongiae TaxID=2901381 RepID=UPI001F36007A|nr:WD40 repeat domain-containing protein [Cytobacillus spongiae]UII54451.1 WD40 repeat domain-containing protein [Cytobacillus spongiae]
MRKSIQLGLFLVFLTLGLSACSNEVYEEIPPEKDLFITVNIKEMTISFIDQKEEKELTKWQMKKPYTGGLMLPDQDTLLLYGKQVETVDLFSISKGELIESWDTGKGLANAIVLDNQSEIVFADQIKSQIRFFNLSGKETGQVTSQTNPLTILEGRKSGKLYVISYHDKELLVIDPDKKERSSSFMIHPSAAGAFLKESSQELWIGGHGEGVEIESDIHVYDLRDGRLKKTISAPLMPVNFVGNEKYVFVLSHGTSTLYKLNVNGDIEGSIKIGANPFELMLDHNQLVIAGYDSDDLHLVDPETLVIHNTIKVGKGPFQIIQREIENK